MTTKTPAYSWIDKFDEMVDKEGPIEWASSTDRRNVFKFIDTLLEEARQSGREAMRREAIWQCERELAYNGASGHDEGDVYIERCIKRIQESNIDLPPIQSL